MKSVMSWKMYQQLKLNDLDTANIYGNVVVVNDSITLSYIDICSIHLQHHRKPTMVDVKDVLISV